MDGLGENGTLSSKQRALLTALITHRTIEGAAAAAGVSKTSAYRWLQQPAFSDALKQFELAAMNEASRALISLHGKATRALENVLDDPLASPSTKIRAAAEVVSAMIKIREFASHEERIAALEERLNVAEGRH